MLFEAGPVTLTIEVSGFSGSFAYMFVELANHSIAKGSPRTRLQLVPMELHPDREGVQRCELEFTAYRHIAYKVSGHIHGDNPIKASGLKVVTSKAAAPLYHVDRTRGALSTRPLDTANVRETGRIFDLTGPQFDQPYSQAMTTGQLRHPAFLRLQAELFSDDGRSTLETWPEVFILRILETFGKAYDKQAAIGFDAMDGTLWIALLARGHQILVVERSYDPATMVDLGAIRQDLLGNRSVRLDDDSLFHHSLIGEALPPEYCREFDVAWWITRNAEDRRSVLRGLLNVAESLDTDGVGVAIFPIHYKEHDVPGAVSFKFDLPRILIDVISLGYKLVQVRLTPLAVQQTATVTYFAIVVHNPDEGEPDDLADGNQEPA